MKIVINRCFGGYGLSRKAVLEIAKRKGMKIYPIRPVKPLTFDGSQKYEADDGMVHVLYHLYTTKPLTKVGTIRKNSYFHPERGWSRTEPDLVSVVEEMGVEANGDYADLAVVEIPDDVSWEIEEYDGRESIHEAHRSW